jgi:hypothetical protein
MPIAASLVTYTVSLSLTSIVLCMLAHPHVEVWRSARDGGNLRHDKVPAGGPTRIAALSTGSA